MNTDIIYAVKRQNVSPKSLEEIREKFYMKEYESPIHYRNVSRFKNVRTVRDSQTGKLYHENINTPYIMESSQDQIFTVTTVEENRLDIISNNYYKTPRYWWVIAIANYIIDPFDVPLGTRLRIPPIISLYKNGGLLSGN